MELGAGDLAQLRATGEIVGVLDVGLLVAVEYADGERAEVSADALAEVDLDGIIRAALDGALSGRKARGAAEAIATSGRRDENALAAFRLLYGSA